MALTNLTEDNEPVRRLFDSDGKCRGYTSTPDTDKVSAKETIEWSISLLEGETGLKTEFTFNDDGTVTLTGDWLTEEVTVPSFAAPLAITGVLGGFNSALNGKGKAKDHVRTQSSTFGFPSLFGGPIF